MQNAKIDSSYMGLYPQVREPTLTAESTSRQGKLGTQSVEFHNRQGWHWLHDGTRWVRSSVAFLLHCLLSMTMLALWFQKVCSI